VPPPRPFLIIECSPNLSSSSRFLFSVVSLPPQEYWRFFFAPPFFSLYSCPQARLSFREAFHAETPALPPPAMAEEFYLPVPLLQGDPFLLAFLGDFFRVSSKGGIPGCLMKYSTSTPVSGFFPPLRSVRLLVLNFPAHNLLTENIRFPSVLLPPFTFLPFASARGLPFTTGPPDLNFLRSAPTNAQGRRAIHFPAPPNNFFFPNPVNPFLQFLC